MTKTKCGDLGLIKTTARHAVGYNLLPLPGLTNSAKRILQTTLALPEKLATPGRCSFQVVTCGPTVKVR